MKGYNERLNKEKVGSQKSFQEKKSQSQILHVLDLFWQSTEQAGEVVHKWANCQLCTQSFDPFIPITFPP